MRRKKRSSNRSHRHAGRTCKLQQRAGRQLLGGPAQHATPSGPVQHGPEQVQLAQELAAAQAGARGPGNKVEQQPSLHIRWPKLQGSTSRPSPCEVAAHKVTHARCTGRTSSQADSREQVLPHFVTPLKGDERASGRPCTPIMHTSFRHTTTTTLLQPSPLSSSGLRFYAWFLDRWPRNASAFPGAFTAGPAARVAHESVIR